MINTVCEVLKISRSAYFKYKKEERPIIALLEKYFSQEDLNEFLNTKKISKLEVTQNSAIFLLEDYAHFSLSNKLEQLFNIFGIPDFTKFLPKKLFLKILQDLKKEDISHENAKDFLLQRLKGYETSLTKLEHPNHPKILYDFVENKLAKIEVYILILNAEKYLK